VERRISSVTASRQTVITGSDALATSVAAALADRGHTVSLLVPRPDVIDQLPKELIQRGRIVARPGDATKHRDLRRAAIQDADVALALSDSDSENALVGQLARHVYQVPTVICRIDDPTAQEMYTGLGLDAVSGTALVTRSVLEACG
jgi:Trk K+ transport system NAD-binding subunit